MKTKQKDNKAVKKGKAEVSGEIPVNVSMPKNTETKITTIHKGKGLQLTLANAVIVSNNMNKPFHSKEYDSYSSSVAIEVSEAIKKAIYENLASSFEKEKGLELALTNFLEKKLKKLDSGKEVLYASVSWKVVNGSLALSKPLPISGISGNKFPYSFVGTIQIGFSYSLQHTFACYLNGVVIEEIISWESDYTTLATDSVFNPQIPVTDENDSEETEQEVQEETKPVSKKGKENLIDKVKKLW